jgi:phospholipid/cholesterol/gamma-HCH transport system substrate-binding protein
MRTRAVALELQLLILAVLAAAGLASAAYVLFHERAPVPFRKTYDIQIALSSADGIAPGIGQPVVVAGVRVGTIARARVNGGNALVTLTIDRGQLPRVYGDATAALEPITPLKDMQVVLDPGRAPARPLREGGTIPIARTQVPVPLSDLLSTLDSDTRDFLTSLVASMDQGTRHKGDNLRRALLALGPTTAQARLVTTALSSRRRELARLVHNLAIVTREASRDGRLAEVVSAGDRTMQALATQDVPLRRALRELPGTMRVTRGSLVRLEPFARKLRPTLTALLPAVSRLPATFRALRPFADMTTSTLSRQLRPLVRDAQPLVRELAPAVTDLTPVTPNLTSTFQSVNYFLNELAYNPPGSDEGGLFWLAWFGHNFQSLYSTRDAHGAIGRAIALVDCQQLTFLGPADDFLRAAMGVASLCPEH